MQHRVSTRAQSALSDPTHPEGALVPLNKGPLFSTQTGRLQRQKECGVGTCSVVLVVLVVYLGTLGPGNLVQPVRSAFCCPAVDRPDHRLSEQGRPKFHPAIRRELSADRALLFLQLSVAGLEKGRLWPLSAHTRFARSTASFDIKNHLGASMPGQGAVNTVVVALS